MLSCAELGSMSLAALVMRYGLNVKWVGQGIEIPGSYWGESEAGLIGCRLFVRDDTPVHSALHEACHYICMDTERRTRLHTDAGGEDIEESGVCYLQILLAGHLPGVGRLNMFADMDTWGYSFRLGSVRAWFEQDAEDARNWLVNNGLIDSNEQLLWQLRK
ncbi:MAG: hypothetical protein CSA09_02855 [Candidatus Contendobacter odensis]|uniref:Uncharacterized protein n=1 Tax=Candidatus Contendibacter odensensis TaxID=1400860 RepID=A0A2G6PFB3_9GAMM|nr:MAG: hypothetical protein CSA09_02855 [Candidatus Contendobacter odensis]